MDADRKRGKVVPASVCVETLTRSIGRGSPRRMRHIHTHDHRRRTLEPRPTVRIQFMVDTT